LVEEAIGSGKECSVTKVRFVTIRNMNKCVWLFSRLLRATRWHRTCFQLGSEQISWDKVSDRHHTYADIPHLSKEENMKNLLAGTLLSLSLALPAFAQDVVIVPDPVTTWVTEQPLDDDVVVEKDVVVGDALPDKVVIKNVKDHDDFGYAVVNKRRVVVEPKTRKVVKIID
jgi:hypothetical protein